MEKKFSRFEIATIKRTAQSVNPMVTRKNKLEEMIAELQAEYNQLSLMQEQYEASIKTITGGYGTEDIIEKVIEETGTIGKDGKLVKTTKYVLKYPDTIIPPTSITENPEGEIDDEAKVDTVEYKGEDTSPIDTIVDAKVTEWAMEDKE